MGQMVSGVWHDDPAERASADDDGRFRRVASLMRNWVTADGRPGPTGVGGFPAEPGRYHLYVAINCPWAHRTLIMRALKRLNDVVSLSVVAATCAESSITPTFGPIRGSFTRRVGSRRP